MILVGQYDSPYTRRVAIALHLLELPFTRDTRSVFADADAMRTINPLGRIPSLVLDDGEVLIDSAAILDYLDDRVGPERALLPAQGSQRRRALQISALASGILDKAGTIIYERTLRPPDKQLASWLDRCAVQVSSGLAALEAVTAPGWYVERFSQADITVGCVIHYFALRGLALFSAVQYPKLAQLAETCEALPAFAITRPAPDEVMPDGLSTSGGE
ncbi:MAG: glutathione S-transferase family protein [Kofleriaceae bacterium]